MTNLNEDLNATSVGSQLGEEGVNSVVSKIEQVCAHEQQRIELHNRAVILSLKAEFSLLRDEEQNLKDRLRDAPPPGDLRRHRRKVIFAAIVAVVLTLAGYYFTVLSFDPFRLGWKSYVYCLGIAVVVPFLLHRLLEDPKMKIVVKVLTTVAAVAGLVSVMSLAVIRGNLLQQETQAAPTVVIDDAQPVEAAPNNFYGSTLGLLELATVLMSLTMELGAGLALREAWVPPPHNPEDWQKLQDRLNQVHRRMIEIVTQVTTLENEPSIFAAQFWRDFYGSMLTHTVRNAMIKLLILVAVIGLIPRAHATTTQPRLNLVIALDLSKSVAVKGPDGRTEFQKNVDGVARLLAQAPTGSHVTVIGITDHSFAQPYILLSASVPGDPGYFGEQLNAARKELVRVWRVHSASLTPQFASTDIFGALLLASQIFNQQPTQEQRRLMIFSDMRNSARELHLEPPAAESTRRKTNKTLGPPTVDLRQVQVYALGVDGAGQSTAQWQKLGRFWTAYLYNSGASLNSFSTLRELPTSQERTKMSGK